MPAMSSNKARIAKRVIEVLEFFDEEHPQATVMDIVRRYDRPQSSTSELLSNLVGLGLLYKDRHTRTYSLTPRAALLGNTVQPRFVRDGRLSTLMERLSAQTGLTVAVFSLVGLQTQICSWRAGSTVPRSSAGTLRVGQQDQLTESAIGLLLMSTLASSVRDGMLRRMNAEAPEDRRFRVADMVTQIEQCRLDGYVGGRAGFGTIADIAAVLVPGLPSSQPMAIGFVYEPSDMIDAGLLLQTLRDAVTKSATSDDMPIASVSPLVAAA